VFFVWILWRYRRLKKTHVAFICISDPPSHTDRCHWKREYTATQISGADICFVLLIYRRSEDEDDTELKCEAATQRCVKSTPSHPVAVIGRGQLEGKNAAVVKHPIQKEVCVCVLSDTKWLFGSCAVAVDFSWIEYVVNMQLELGHRVEINNIKFIKQCTIPIEMA